MNDKDLNNLNFILNVDDASFDDWLNQASDDDIDYALQLIQQARKDYTMKELELLDLEELDLTEANNVISRFRKKS
jgi:hypothetical protein